MIRRRVRVTGRVQGVFFRETVRRRAESERVAGWVRNLADGAVEAVFEGEADAVDRLIAFCEQGPRDAQVDWVDISVEEPEALDGFSVR